MSAVQVEAYGSEKGELSVDDITNVLKTHDTERVGRNKGLQNDVPQKEGYGWFLLFCSHDFCMCLKILCALIWWNTFQSGLISGSLHVGNYILRFEIQEHGCKDGMQFDSQ